jgi:hypothetical protein
MTGWVRRSEYDRAVCELVELAEELLAFSRGGTFDEEPGEYELRFRAQEVVGRYKPATEEMS